MKKICLTFVLVASSTLGFSEDRSNFASAACLGKASYNGTPPSWIQDNFNENYNEAVAAHEKTRKDSPNYTAKDVPIFVAPNYTGGFSVVLFDHPKRAIWSLKTTRVLLC